MGHFEHELQRRMALDGWTDIPRYGEKGDTTVPKVLAYIDWLRSGKDSAKTSVDEMYEKAKNTLRSIEDEAACRRY